MAPAPPRPRAVQYPILDMPDYSVYGITIRLPFEVLQIPRAQAGSVPDVELIEADVPMNLSDPVAEDLGWQAAVGQYLVRAGGRAGRFLVDGPDRIVLQRSPNSDQAFVVHLLLHDVMAGVLRHRGDLVLHANAVVTEAGSGAVAISGVSGAGKSTTTARLLESGGALITDDLTVLRAIPGGGVSVQPGIGEIHLTDESLLALDVDTAGLPRYPWRAKAAVPFHSVMVSEPQRLRDIYLLTVADVPDVRLTRQTGAGLFDALQDCIYGPLLAVDTERVFGLQANVCQTVRVWRIERPSSAWSLEDVREAIQCG